MGHPFPPSQMVKYHFPLSCVMRRPFPPSQLIETFFSSNSNGEPSFFFLLSCVMGHPFPPSQMVKYHFPSSYVVRHPAVPSRMVTYHFPLSCVMRRPFPPSQMIETFFSSVFKWWDILFLCPHWWGIIFVVSHCGQTFFSSVFKWWDILFLCPQWWGVIFVVSHVVRHSFLPFHVGDIFLLLSQMMRCIADFVSDGLTCFNDNNNNIHLWCTQQCPEHLQNTNNLKTVLSKYIQIQNRQS